MLVHRGVIFVIEGDIVLLSQTALRDLGVIPKTFPMIGEFGGVEQKGNGHDKLEIDSKYNMRYIAEEPGPKGRVLEKFLVSSIHF